MVDECRGQPPLSRIRTAGSRTKARQIGATRARARARGDLPDWETLLRQNFLLWQGSKLSDFLSLVSSPPSSLSAMSHVVELPIVPPPLPASWTPPAATGKSISRTSRIFPEGFDGMLTATLLVICSRG